MSNNRRKEARKRFSIRKFSIGVFSILIGISFAQLILNGNGLVSGHFEVKVNGGYVWNR